MLLRAVECTLQKAVAETFSGWQKWSGVFSRVTRICMKIWIFYYSKLFYVRP